MLNHLSMKSGLPQVLHCNIPRLPELLLKPQIGSGAGLLTLILFRPRRDAKSVGGITMRAYDRTPLQIMPIFFRSPKRRH